MIEINNKTRSRINLVLVKRVAESFLKYYNKNNNEASIAFVGDKTIRYLNKTYRGIDKITDVLAFPDGPAKTASAGGRIFLGEVIINYIQVKRQAKKFSHSAKQELVFILVHGLLHLLGYNDNTETGRRQMEKIGEEFVIKTKIENS